MFFSPNGENFPFLTSLGFLKQNDSAAAGMREPWGALTTTMTSAYGDTDSSMSEYEKVSSARRTLDDTDDDGSPPLMPFVTPPPPAKLSLKHRYYSLARSECATVHVMSDWEKNAILSRLKRGTPVNEERFQQRLCLAQQRNTDFSINKVRCRVKDREDEVAYDREQRFIVQEKRREQIFLRHRDLLRLREIEKFVNRAQSWYRIVVCHVFLTALIQERKVHEALETFSHLLAPMIKCHLALKRRRREAQELTKSQLHNIPFPFPQVIQSMYGSFFNGWPPLLLEKLVSNAKPTYLEKGSYLMHEGDIGRVMFMITTGTVSIILRKKGKDKRRTKDNSNGVFEITAPCYVGEFALVCKEPRSASIFCETDIGFWAVRPEDYEDVAKHLSPEVASKQREATDVRRRQNLQKFFPLKTDFLRKFPYFQLFSNAGLEKIISCVEPMVLHDGDYLFQSGEMNSSVYFIQDGIAMRRDAKGNECKVTTGSCVGMFECSCGVNERKQYSIVSVNYCDVWRMKRETLIDIGMSEPVALLHCRKSAKADRALMIAREPKAPLFLRNDPYLSFCFPIAYINKLYDLCSPVVYLNGEKITVMGQSVSTLVILLSGTVDVTVANSGEQETFRLDATECRARYSTAESAAAAPSNLLALGNTSVAGGGGVDNGTAGKPKKSKKRGDTASKGATVGSVDADDKGSSKRPSASASITAVLGAYEFAASVSQYTYTVTSFSLTEALQIERSKLEAILPPDLRTIIHDSVKARELVVKAYRRRTLSILTQNLSCSFARMYKEARDSERESSRKAGNNPM